MFIEYVYTCELSRICKSKRLEHELQTCSLHYSWPWESDLLSSASICSCRKWGRWHRPWVTSEVLLVSAPAMLRARPASPPLSSFLHLVGTCWALLVLCQALFQLPVARQGLRTLELLFSRSHGPARKHRSNQRMMKVKRRVERWAGESWAGAWGVVKTPLCRWGFKSTLLSCNLHTTGHTDFKDTGWWILASVCTDIVTS